MTASMCELAQILRDHAARYPLMEPTDAVKLIYQNEFGGGHLIPDGESCLTYLRREYSHIEKEAAAPLYEEIGNGIVRVSLAAVKEGNLDALGRAFIRSARAHTGSMASFSDKLTLLQQMTRQGSLPFSPARLDACLAAYRAAGCPMVSHSEAYRNAYRPAYRVILKGTFQETL